MALMNRMRSNTKIILMILVVAFMLTIIIDWGMGGFQSNQPRGVIATVNGSDITYDEYTQQYQNEVASWRENNGEEPSSYQINQIENQVFEGLVQQRLLSQAVKNLKLETTDEEIAEEIFTNPPAFLIDNEAFKDSTGTFDMNRYQAALNNPSADQFWGSVEQYLRSTLPLQKLSSMLNSAVTITDDDARQEFKRTNAKVKVHYVFYNTANIQNKFEPTEEDIKNYYNNNKKDFQENEKRVLEYVLLENTPTAIDTAGVWKDAQDLIEDVKSGKDFAELAVVYSQDPGSAEKGGDIDYFSREEMVKPFSDAAFDAKIGDIVGPVVSQFGLHIIKVVDKKKIDDVDKVRASHILLKFEVSPATREAQRNEAEYIAEAAASLGLKTVVEAESLKVTETQPFEKDAFIPGIGMERRVNYFAYRSKVGDVSNVFTLDQGNLVVSLAKIIPEHIKPLDDVKAQIITSLKTKNNMKIAGEAAQKAYERMKNGMPMDQSAAMDSLQVQETDFFNMTGTIARIGKEPAFTGAAFGLNDGEFSQPVEGTRGYYILQVVDKQPINEELFQAQKEQLKLQLAARFKQQAFSEWYTQLKEKANIKDLRYMYF